MSRALGLGFQGLGFNGSRGFRVPNLGFCIRSLKGSMKGL